MYTKFYNQKARCCLKEERPSPQQAAHEGFHSKGKPSLRLGLLPKGLGEAEHEANADGDDSHHQQQDLPPIETTPTQVERFNQKSSATISTPSMPIGSSPPTRACNSTAVTASTATGCTNTAPSRLQRHHRLLRRHAAAARLAVGVAARARGSGPAGDPHRAGRSNPAGEIATMPQRIYNSNIHHRMVQFPHLPFLQQGSYFFQDV